MEMPKIDKPTIEDWKSQEDEFMRLLDNIDKNIFDLKKWEFLVPEIYKHVSYEELMKQVTSKKMIDYQWADAMRSFFKNLPEHFGDIKKKLISAMTGFTRVLEERINYEQALEQYCKATEGINESLRDEISEMTKEQEIIQTKNEIAELRARLKESQEQYERLSHDYKVAPMQKKKTEQEAEDETKRKY